MLIFCQFHLAWGQLPPPLGRDSGPVQAPDLLPSLLVLPASLSPLRPAPLRAPEMAPGNVPSWSQVVMKRDTLS